MFKTQQILHFSIPVTDLERSCGFYKDLLGCELVHSNPLMRFMKCGNSNFVLVRMPNLVPANPPGETNNHHAFVVASEDFDSAMKDMERAGIQLLKYEGFGHRTFPGRHAYYQDPDGNAIELIDYTPDEVVEGDGPPSLAHAIESQMK